METKDDLEECTIPLLDQEITTDVVGGNKNNVENKNGVKSGSKCNNISTYSNISRWHPYSKTIVWLAAITILSSMYYIHQYNNEFDNIIYTVTKDSFADDEIKLSMQLFDNISSKDAAKNYVVFNEKCRIPNLDPFNDDVKPYIKKKAYVPCTKFDPLTDIKQLYNGYSELSINNKLRKLYAPKSKITCCYSIIRRELYKGKTNIDNSYTSTVCTNFSDNVVFNKTVEFIIVKCTVKKGSHVETVYSNSHSVVPLTSKVLERFEKKLNISVTINSTGIDQQPISVIMIGIDSISRLNFYRSMPETAKYLQANKWFELQGYNKMDDNTFPNLMAIFAGYNQSTAYGVCNPKQFNKLNNCTLIFYKYRDLGYATAYGEDEGSISTFNFNKKGFNATPTDHYLRPLVLASAHTLKLKRVDGLDFCVGSETSEELILNYAEQFLQTYKNYPYFGFFWMNSFSHNEVNEPSMVDIKTKQWFEKIAHTGVYNKSIIVFLSDHGIRFGRIRQTNSGWLEERLPFIYFWLPKWFQKKYPEAVHNLQTNKNRFTTPYDLHMTLQDILIKSNLTNKLVPSLSCPKCQSLFEEMDVDRGCEDANITMHWCTCYGYQATKSSLDVTTAADIILKRIKLILSSNHESFKLCRVPTLKNILEARISTQRTTGVNYYLLVIELSPAGKFEATVKQTVDNGKKKYELSGDISRIDTYGSQSHCMNTSFLKKFCYCKR